ncbi:MAG: hypothetical protein GY854_17130 [Deltaproteobacteria bacterium]|nr:hypothetical protein [Deltaproteobacteria bacterium]
MTSQLQDDRGAMMVMAVFVAIILVGLVYHVAGLGGASLEQQIMQDGADATAFSAATVNARGMNIIALLNLIMVALLTILVALRLVQAILVVVVVILTVACAFPPHAGCALVAPVEMAQHEVKAVADGYQKVAKVLIKALAKAEDAINVVVPLIALGEGIYVSTNKPYSQVATGGVVWPVFDGLPTKKGEYSELCKRAGKNITVPIELILPPGVGDFVGDTLGGLIGELTETFSFYFCGDDGAGGTPDKPKKKTLKKQVGYPPGRDENSKMRNCMSESASLHPSEGNGRCYSDSCRTCARLGCEFCFDAMRNNSSYKRGMWTVVENHWVEWTDPDGTMVKLVARDEVRDKWSSKEIKGNPCGHKDNPEPGKYENSGCGGYSHAWGHFPADTDPDLVPEIDEYFPRAICQRIAEEEVTDSSDIYYYQQKRQEKKYKVLEFSETPQMFLKKQIIYVALTSCTVVEEIDVEAQGEPMIGPGENKDDLAPRVLDEERFPDDAEMTSILWGKRRAGRRLKGVGIGAKTGGGGKSFSDRFGFAAAEYYSQNSDKESMWHMQWLSRLIRFQLTDDSEDGDSTSGQDQTKNNKKGREMMNQAMDSITSKLGGGVSIDDYLLH